MLGELIVSVNLSNSNALFNIITLPSEFLINTLYIAPLVYIHFRLFFERYTYLASLIFPSFPVS